MVDGRRLSIQDFVRSSPVGGDFAGQTAEATLRAVEAQAHAHAGNIDPAEYVFLPSFLNLSVVC